MADAAQIRVASEVAWRETGGQIILLDGKVETYLALNRTGTLLWPQLVEGSSRAALAESLVTRFDVSGEVAERDVERFLGLLAAHGLLQHAAT